MNDSTQAFYRALPSWAQLLLPVAVPLANILIGIVALALTTLVLRQRAEGAHWTERSRWHFAGYQVVGSTALIGAGFTLTFTALVWFDLLSDRHRVALLLPATGFVIALIGFPVLVSIGHLLKWRRARWFWPALGFGTYFQSWFGRRWIQSLIYSLVGALALFGPATLGLPLIAVQLATLSYIVWILRGGALTLGRWCGLMQPASPRLQRIVEKAAEQSNHPVPGALIEVSRYLNASAYPAPQQVVVTSGAMEALDDSQVHAIVLHEVGHLRDHSIGRGHLLPVLAVLMMISLFQPLRHWAGGGGYAILLGVTILLTHLLGQGAKQGAEEREEAADAHATQALEDTPGVYARSLERLHEGNLVPAVTQTKDSPHPCLYDRMLLAGVTPDYPRPAPQPSVHRQLLLITLLTLPLYCGELYLTHWLRRSTYRSPEHGVWSVVVTGGSADAIGALGYHWRKTNPDAAEAAWKIAANHSKLPEFAALLAERLAASDPAAARDWLARAEEVWSKSRFHGPWRRQLLENAREALSR